MERAYSVVTSDSPEIESSVQRTPAHDSQASSAVLMIQGSVTPCRVGHADDSATSALRSPGESEADAATKRAKMNNRTAFISAASLLLPETSFREQAK